MGVKNIISLGAGVQSSTMALMAAHGEITPMPDCAIFADTGAEPKGVYKWLDILEWELPFPVHRVSAGNLRDNLLSTELGRSASIPAFTKFSGSTGMTRRQCTREYKIEPIMKKVRELIGLKPRQRGPKAPVVTQWIGISWDEVQRMKPSREVYIAKRHPLIDLRMTRRHCLDWMRSHGYPEPAKSACTFCPYHDNALWRDMRDNDPESWQQAVAVDAALRGESDIRAKRAMKGAMYLHRDCVPLDQVDLRSAEDAGQGRLFGNECEGICGV
jgi:hypothetical protein